MFDVFFSCPWINNCVGEWNQKYFLQFLFYVALLSAYSIFLVATSWYFHGAEGEFHRPKGKEKLSTVQYGNFLSQFFDINFVKSAVLLKKS